MKHSEFHRRAHTPCCLELSSRTKSLPTSPPGRCITYPVSLWYPATAPAMLHCTWPAHWGAHHSWCAPSLRRRHGGGDPPEWLCRKVYLCSCPPRPPTVLRLCQVHQRSPPLRQKFHWLHPTVPCPFVPCTRIFASGLLERHPLCLYQVSLL